MFSFKLNRVSFFIVQILSLFIRIMSSTVLFEQLFDISRLVSNSKQKILTYHALALRPTQMHTKLIHTVFPRNKKRDFQLIPFYHIRFHSFLLSTRKCWCLQCQSLHLNSYIQQYPRNNK